MILISQKQLKEKISIPLVIKITNKAFIANSSNRVIMPDPLVFELPNNDGEICIKTALVVGLLTYTIKQVSVINKNLKRNIPTLNATMNVYNRLTGELLAVIDEKGWLTNLRTACAGAITEKMFRKRNCNTLGVIGSGAQASWQIKVILSCPNKYKKIIIWNRTPQKAILLKNILSKIYPKINFEVTFFVKDLVLLSDTIICATSSKDPIIKKNMINNGKTIISIGSDMPNKCEVDPQIYSIANKIFVDNIKSNKILGNIKRAIDSDCIQLKNISGEIGDLLLSGEKGRENDNQLILVSLVGLGSQDTYVGDLVYKTFKNK
jgi:ornithine cyclodeaminase